MAGEIRNLLNRNGRYFARVVVPVKLREVLGKSELRTALGADRRQAIQKLHGAVAKLQDMISDGHRRLGSVDVKPPRRLLSPAELAHVHYQELLERDDALRNMPPLKPQREEIPEDQKIHRPFDYPRATIGSFNLTFAPGYEKALTRVASGEAENDEFGAVVGVTLDDMAARGFIDAKRGSAEWRSLARMIASVEIEALRRSFERDLGNNHGTPSYPPLAEPAPRDLLAEPVPLGELLDGHMAELLRSGRGAEAERRWRPCIKALITFLKHDDARRLKRNDVIKWKDELLLTLAPKTVRDAHISALKAILQWGVDAGRLETNVGENVRVRVPTRAQGRERGLTEDEAIAVLGACLDYKRAKGKTTQTSENSYTFAAKRWIPWLCAFTGARVAEIAQLRKEDVQTSQGVRYIRLTPDAGSVKTRMYRDVPLHLQLLELGFGDFVGAAGEGPLFFDGASLRGGRQHPSKQVA